MNIYIIEDSLLVSHLLKTQLKKISKDINVQVFQKVTYALAQVDKYPDVIILDHYLLGYNGTESLPSLKYKYPLSKIIMFSGQADVKVLAEAFEKGADMYFSKNEASSKELLSVVDQIMQETNIQLPLNESLLVNKLKKLFLKKTKSRDKKKVFIVEDDSLFAFMLAKKINNKCDVDIEHYTSASTCINNLGTDPDVIILDYYLEGNSTADEVIDELERKNVNTELIILSGQKDVVKASDLMQKKIVNHYFVKTKDSFDKIITLIK